MAKCLKCGEEVREGLKRCEDCGTPVPQSQPKPEEPKKPEPPVQEQVKPKVVVKPVIEEPKPQPIQKPAAQVKTAATATMEYSQEVVTKGIARWHTLFLLVFGIGCLVASLFIAGGIQLFNSPESTAKKVVAAYNAGDAVGIVNLVPANNYGSICQQANLLSGNMGAAAVNFFGGMIGKKPTCDRDNAVKSMQTVLDSKKGAQYSFTPGQGTDASYSFTISVAYNNQTQKIPSHLSNVDGNWVYDYR